MEWNGMELDGASNLRPRKLGQSQDGDGRGTLSAWQSEFPNHHLLLIETSALADRHLGQEGIARKARGVGLQGYQQLSLQRSNPTQSRTAVAGERSSSTSSVERVCQAEDA